MCSKDGKGIPSTSRLRQDIAKHILDPSNGGYDIGLSLGFMARHFGARAPVRDLAHQILSDCTRILSTNHDRQNVRVSYWNGHETLLDFEHFYWIEMGINTAVLEWWLGGPYFSLAYERYCEWVSRLEDDMEMLWEAFWVGIYDENFYSGTDLERFDERQQRLQAREEGMYAEIEAAAISLGL